MNSHIMPKRFKRRGDAILGGPFETPEQHGNLEDRTVWSNAYCAALLRHPASRCVEIADQALVDYRKKFK